MKYLKKYDFDTFVENKYNHLLVAMVVLFLVSPLYLKTGLKFPLIMCIFFIIIQLALRATIDNKKRLLLYRLLVLMALVCMLLPQLKSMSSGASNLFYVTGRIVFVVFILWTIRLFMGRILAAEKMTTDKIKGGICLYFLAGIMWCFLYEVIYQFDSAAFRLETVNPLTFMYYSFSTLTSLGLGDITPTNNFAISFTCLEAIAGQMFLAVFIARIIGLHIIQKNKPIEEERE